MEEERPGAATAEVQEIDRAVTYASDVPVSTNNVMLRESATWHLVRGSLAC